MSFEKRKVFLDRAGLSDLQIDSPEEILANKLCALLSRSEIRDLVDARELERAGFKLEDALAAAQLAWVLSQIKFGDDLTPPDAVSIAELRNYLDNLISRLQRILFPNNKTLKARRF